MQPTRRRLAFPQAGWRRWPQLGAVRNATIYSMPSDTVARATPRLVEGVRTICSALDDARGRIARGRDGG